MHMNTLFFKVIFCIHWTKLGLDYLYKNMIPRNASKRGCDKTQEDWRLEADVGLSTGLIPGVAVGVIFSEVVSAGELAGSTPLVVLAGAFAGADAFEAIYVIQ